MAHPARPLSPADQADGLLKLYPGRRERDTCNLSADMTLGEFYRAFFRPVILVAQGAEPARHAGRVRPVDHL